MSDPITVRSFVSGDDYAACVALQRETWGREFADVVPASILQVAQKIGGVAAGAFDSGGRLLGFVFGMTGVEDGRVVHWSDMLAVRSDVQNRGLGRQLKEFQRREVVRVGAREIYWTYDPLVARNAHLNINVFGARIVRYVRDMYGTHTGSDLHRGIGTDRLVVAWPVEDADIARGRRVAAAAAASEAFADATCLGDPAAASPAAIPPGRPIRIVVPADIHAVQTADARTAQGWRAANRAAFERAFTTGYRVAGFDATDARRPAYLLAPADA